MTTKTPAYARLADFAPASGDLTPMSAIEGQDLILMAVEPRTTQFGEGYLLTLTIPDDADATVINVLTNAVVVCQQIRKMVEAGFKPCLVSFVPRGRCWVIE